MFDELKEVRYFKEITDFNECYYVKYFKEIKRLESLQKAEAYLEPNRISRWTFFVNILNGVLFSQ